MIKITKEIDVAYENILKELDMEYLLKEDEQSYNIGSVVEWMDFNGDRHVALITGKTIISKDVCEYTLYLIESDKTVKSVSKHMVTILHEEVHHSEIWKRQLSQRLFKKHGGCTACDGSGTIEEYDYCGLVKMQCSKCVDGVPK